jgi:AraC-like DNA-binding protein
MCREALEDIKVFIEVKAFHTHGGKQIALVLSMSKSLLQHLFKEDGDNLVELVNDEQLYEVMDKFKTLGSCNISNFISSFKLHLANKG